MTSRVASSSVEASSRHVRFAPGASSPPAIASSRSTTASSATRNNPGESSRCLPWLGIRIRWPTLREVATAFLALTGVAAIICAIFLRSGDFSISQLSLKSLTGLGSRLHLHTQRHPLFVDSCFPPTMAARSLPVGREDYARGGKVFGPLTTISNGDDSLPAESVVSDDFRLEGCWRIPGRRGQIGVALTEPVYPTHITVDHMPSIHTKDVQQAPRHILLWGVVDGAENLKRSARLLANLSDSIISEQPGPQIDHGFKLVPLAAFEYDVRAPSHVQTFPVHPQILHSGIDFGLVVLEIVNNWGSDATCLYRFRVHGTRAEFVKRRVDRTL